MKEPWLLTNIMPYFQPLNEVFFYFCEEDYAKYHSLIKKTEKWTRIKSEQMPASSGIY